MPSTARHGLRPAADAAPLGDHGPLRVDARQRPGELVRHPDRAGRRRDARGAVVAARPRPWRSRRRRSRSIRDTVPSSGLATQTAPSPTARAATPRLSCIGCVGRGAWPRRSRVTVPVDGLLAQTTPSPHASLPGWLSSVTFAVRRLLPGSRRTTAYSSGAGDPDRAAARRRARRPGCRPGSAAATWFVRGEMTDTVPSWLLATHTPCAPTAIADGACPTGMVWRIVRVSGSTRETRLRSRSVTQTAPAPDAIAVGRALERDLGREGALLGVDRGDRVALDRRGARRVAGAGEERHRAGGRGGERNHAGDHAAPASASRGPAGQRRAGRRHELGAARVATTRDPCRAPARAPRRARAAGPPAAR